MSQILNGLRLLCLARFLQVLGQGTSRVDLSFLELPDVEHCDSRVRDVLSQWAKPENATCEIFNKKATLLQEELSQNKRPKVTVAVFSGRSSSMKVLCRYLYALHGLGLIDEVHLWLLTRVEKDLFWLEELSRAIPVFKLMRCSSHIAGRAKYACPYQYYYNLEGGSEDDVVMKVDDDIVYIDLLQFQAFIQAVKHDSLYFPNIVNNDVCAYLQSRAKVHNLLPSIREKHASKGNTAPLALWYQRPARAIRSHEEFFKCPGRFGKGYDQELVPWYSRVSLNFFALTMRTAKDAFHHLLKHLNETHKLQDEPFLTGMYTLLSDRPMYIFTPLVVSHFAFGLQRKKHNGTEMDVLFQQYERVSMANCLFIP
uniref:Hexosyltransferase n=1 Tax=Tetraselmis sp. GSL018 TaxID=582737 RepID=A0A061SPU8_9CHLO|mmetsp:Transcript_10283/g.24515  ORF Transcript_10283/g.24515 Transcript_10283/m.24515 type:complete len:369 (+) Transcript_10283:159-1265(+)